jgi:hypothetical protein
LHSDKGAFVIQPKFIFFPYYLCHKKIFHFHLEMLPCLSFTPILLLTV